MAIEDFSITNGSMLVTLAGEAFYFGDKNTDGTWRIVVSSSSLVFQRRESGSYVEKSAVTA